MNACLKTSTLWQRVKEYSLKTNMRVLLHNDTKSGYYAKALLKIVEDREYKYHNGMITLQPNFCDVVHSTDELVSEVYPDLQKM